MWADVVPLHGGNGHGSNGHTAEPVPPATKRTQQPLGLSRGPRYACRKRRGSRPDGPIQFGGRVAEHMVQVAYNAQHKIPWHWPVPAYLVTKGIASGMFMLMALGWGLGLVLL